MTVSLAKPASDITPLTDFRLAGGTSLCGHITTSYATLVAAFGPDLGPGDKTQAEWVLQTPAGVATIYDWKMYNTPKEQVTEWNVGGHYTEDLPTVLEVIERHLAQFTR